MRVHSIFLSVDGEVNFMGQGSPSVFLRLQGCNLRCPWCDTKDSQDPEKCWQDLFPWEVRKALLKFFPRSLKGPKITITGGEPLLQEDELHELLNLLFQFGVKISIETNGTKSLRRFLVPKPNLDICLVVDWKPSSVLYDGSDSLNLAEYDQLRPWDWIKFPVASRVDYEEARDFIRHVTTKARLAISPILPQSQIQSVRELWGWMGDDGLCDVSLNIQLHKFVNLA